ncbi:MAG: leucine-rich repeat domain-containing protein [Bacteroidales bacterium]|nr:leucine-rich repeat domain-containing protein [Bacteroidales bacterium]
MAIFVLSPGTLTGGITVTVTTADGGVFEKSTSNKLEIGRSAITKLGALEVVPEYEQPNNVIYYTSSDGEIVTPHSIDAFGVRIVSNEYTDGQGIIEFEGDVTNIGGYAFNDCVNLASLIIPESVTSIEYGAFLGCSDLASIIIPEGVISIGAAAFCLSGLVSVHIPESVTYLGETAFTNCEKLVRFSGKYASEDGRYLYDNGTLVAFAPAGLDSYSIPDSVTGIGQSAFYYCRGLSSIEIPNSVTSIGVSAFAATALSSVIIPSSVTSIGINAFGLCWNLRSITVEATTPPQANGWIFDTSFNFLVYVPSESVDSYKTAEGWSNYADRIQAIPSVSATDLSAEGTANCYIVPSSGKYSFLAVKGNTLEPVGDVKGVKVLWETFGTKDIPEVGSIISPSVYYYSGTNTIIFETNENYTQGSALIAAFSDTSCTEGNVLWSWHIWCTSDDLSSHLVNLRNNAGTIMDRNLGATGGTRSEYSCFSLLYQYGRKDPFLGGYHKDTQTIQQAASTGEWNTAALTGYDNAVKNPTTFFSSWAEGDDDTISWPTQKSMYDPCPPGYRIPDKYVYSAAAEYYYGESSMWSIGTRGTTIFWYNGNNYSDYQSVWFPNTNALYDTNSGLRSHRVYGSTTRDGAVWTCGGSFYSAMYDGYVNTVSSWDLIPKKTGNAVRCVTESSPVVVNTESVSLSLHSITIDPNTSFDISASVYPSNANVNAINWHDLSSRFTMTTNDDGSVRFTDNTGTIGRYNIGAYSPLALYGSNDEWRIRWNGSLADICEVTVCPSEPTDYRYDGGWYLKAKAGDTISFSYFIGDDNDGNNDFSIYVGGQLVYEYPYHYSACSGDFSYTFEESFSGWVYLCWGWCSDIWNITTTATVLGRGEPYPSSVDRALNDRWISQPSYKFEYNNHVLTMH